MHEKYEMKTSIKSSNCVDRAPSIYSEICKALWAYFEYIKSVDWVCIQLGL